MEIEQLQRILEGALLASNKPLTLEHMMALFPEEEAPDANAFREALVALSESCEGRGFELKQVASGYRFQVRQELATWVGRLWEEKPQRYTRALLETLALIAYRQPITRGEIEEIRGVSVSSNIVRTLQEREWIRVVGHRDVPGRPAMFATTRQFLDYFNLQNLNELPPLSEIRDLEKMAKQLTETPEQGSLEVEPAETTEAVDASEVHEVIDVEEQSAAALFAELDEMEADLPDNFDDLIKKQKVESLEPDEKESSNTESVEDSGDSTESTRKTPEDSL
ncbi:segregation and condensation protein B [Endozoicomonas montiporae]|uniref:Segregation and condensation protein B n=2 Tax=Endozoicomonas montiporae TaxID=1027273 RepID=A0A081N790_9GAMM|nr:SMC-Scp complex subunit ScpB [Endozoicomonas montiporae]AMO55862.1 condensin subunit ScpB [Endozoicomonas montiporae CL-33]KEQ14313.1 segregation and condensation protein B [Endozoicomonas montiporae]